MNRPVQGSLEELRRAVKLKRLQERGATTLVASVRSKIGIADRSAPLPLSWGQQRFWFLAQLDAAAGAAYHLPLGLRLAGALDRAALGATLNQLVARHEVLRTSFGQHNGEPFQRIQPADTGFTLSDHDLSALAPAAQADEIERIRAEEYELAFDMASGPLCRGRLLILNNHEHVLLITLHHIVSDAWSNGVLVREMSALYAAFCQHRPDPLPPLSLQYADYAQWQRNWLHGEALQAQLDYWTGHLRGAPHLLSLPTDRPRPPAQSYHGSSMRVVIPAELSARLRELTREHGAILFMTVLAAWTILLSRLSGQHDVVVGSPIANRQRSETESLIGFFVNTLALRVNMEDDPTVTELLARVKQSTLGAYEYQDLPFEQVVEAVNPPRSMGHSPIFQTSLNVASVVESEEMRLPGLELSAIKQGIERTQCDLMLALADQGSVISGSLIYAVDLFDCATMERLCGHLETLLQSMIDNPQRRVSQLDLLSVQERQQLVHGFNATATSGPPPMLLQHMFEANAAAHPQAPALRDALGTLSYGELNARANCLAHHLLTQGVKPDDRVALCATRGEQMVIGLLGILKAGAAYVPLDPAYPQQRLAFMLVDSAPKMLLTLDALADKLRPLCQQHGIAVLLLDGAADAAIVAAQPRSNPDVGGLGAQQLAYLIYTSGSTGQPKGVMVEHGGLSNYLEWARSCYAFGQPCNSVVSSPLAFDATITSLYVPLISGGTVTLIADGDELEGLEALLRRGNACGLIKITPAHLSVLGQRLRDAGVVCAAQTFIVGGEAFPADTARLWQQVAPQSRLFNEYGPTETVVGCSTYEFYVDAVQGEQVPIGRPISNTQMYVLDALMQPVAPGVSGEIYIGGAGVARGYLNRPELSAERFVADPFRDRPGARLYKTGDLGRLLADGNLEYLGRNDFQVKVLGFRIELGEIEACLVACAGVREAIVIAREDQPGDKRLVAYLLVAEGNAPSVAALRAQLEEQLAPYMVPSAFVMLDSFPLTSNGKLDRVALPVPGREALLAHDFEAPEGETETALALIWQDLLKLESVGRTDDFFALGGHSLLAVLLTSRVRQSFGVDLPLKDIFDAPTLSGLAATIARGSSTVGDVIVACDRSEALPLSWAQQRLWFLDQLDHAAGAAYNSPTGLRLCGVLNEGALQATLDRIMARHESLRTRFVLAEGQPVQVIATADIGFVLARHNLSGLTTDQQASEVTRISTEEANQAFDLGAGPLVRGRLLRIAPEEHVLLLTLHHIVTDGWSNHVLVREFSTLYAAYCEGQSDPLPPLAIQYADYAVWQRNWLQGEQFERQLGFWKAHLDDAPALLALPTDRPRPPVQSYAGGHAGLRLPAELVASLRTLSQRHGVSLFMTMLAGWSVLLARISGQDDVVIGTPIANRHRAETEGLIGFFVNTLALRVRLDAALSVEQLLAQVKDTTLAAYAHQDFPFEQVVEALRPTRSMDHSPIFQSMLTMNNVPETGELVLPGLTLSGLAHTHTAIHFDLHLTISEVGDGLMGGLSYASDLFDQATAERLVRQFQALLSGMVEGSERSVLRLPLFDDSTRHRLLVEFNDTAAALPELQLMGSAFEAQVAAQPDALAVVYDNDSLTYAELNRRANRVARQLLAQGVVPDDCVALCIERSVEMFVGILGIVKAGAAYVPMDPHNPADRLAYMLSDCSPVAVLTHSSLIARLPALTVPVLALDSAALQQGEAENPDPRALGLTASNLAYVIYTSGSTGAAKGVMVEHHSALNFWAVMKATTHQGCPAQSNIALNASFAFDMSLKGVLQVLSGHCVHIVPQSVRADGALFMEFLAQHQIDAFDCTPSQLELLLAAGLLDGGNYQPGRVLIGGEAINAATWDKLRHCQSIAFFNMYGPTECTVDATIGRIEAEHPRAHLGRPISNAQIYILDRLQQPVPTGMWGEIHIGGQGVARGYLKRPELTAERFIVDPFGAPGGRLYRSGDVGRWLDDGRIEYQGRNDFQVKLRGYRIELGEIEAALAACSGVREAVVLAREDAPGEKRLVAYLVADDGVQLQIANVREQLATGLADYMVPSAFVVLEHLPLNRNGKLDRRALPQPDQSALISNPYEAPQGDIERAISEIWKDLLKIDSIGRLDDFFALGGHSLLAALVIARISSQLAVELPMATLFTHPTLKGLGEAVVELTLASYSADELELAAFDMDDLSDEEIEMLLEKERALTFAVDQKH
jgi:amino acid adenylation domain-containing protein